jgi:hypothetical protein
LFVVIIFWPVFVVVVVGEEEVVEEGVEVKDIDGSIESMFSKI